MLHHLRPCFHELHDSDNIGISSPLEQLDDFLTLAQFVGGKDERELAVAVLEGDFHVVFPATQSIVCDLSAVLNSTSFAAWPFT